MNDSRQDDSARDRIADIGEWMRAKITRQGRMVLGLALVMLVCIGSQSWLLKGYHAQSRRVTAVVAQIQSERVRNTRDACDRDNARNKAIRDFIAGSVPAGRRDDPDVVAYLKRAQRSFPQRDCGQVTATQVRGTKP